MRGRGLSLAWAAPLALAAAKPAPILSAIDEPPTQKREPYNAGRRAEKDAEAMRKAEAKRARKAAKRAKEMK